MGINKGVGKKMKTINYTAARINLAKIIEEVCKGHTPITVTRRNGRSVVVMSSVDYEFMQENMHMLCAPANVETLLESL